MGLAFDGLLVLHVIFALVWVAASFISARAITSLAKSTDQASKNRVLMSQRLVAAAGGLTVLIGLGFYYYVNYYRPAYATSSSGLPFVDAGAVLGILVFIWQMAQGPRIRRAIASMNTGQATTAGSSGMSQSTQVATALPKSWMVFLPGILLILALLLMVAGSSM
jgi:uncharacterized membrane protein